MIHSATPIFENKAAFRDEIGKIRTKSCIDLDSTVHQTMDSRIKIESSKCTSEICNLPLERIKTEPSKENKKPYDLTLDTIKHIKVEEGMFAHDVKTEDDLETNMENSQLQLLTEELNIKPEYDISEDENYSTELIRAVKENVRINIHEVVHKRADKGSFICYHCISSFHSKKDLIYHINVGSCIPNSHVKKTLNFCKRLHQSKEYNCVKCHKIFKSKSAVDDHVIKNHEELIASVSSKIHQCKNCSYQTTFVNCLARHMRKHSDTGYSIEPKLSSCVHCDKTFKCKTTLDNHIIKNHIEFIGSVSSKIHQCKHCNYVTTYASILNRHMLKHSEGMSSVEQFPCIHCDEKFKRKKALDDHIIQNHADFIASVSYKIHQCQYCSYKTTYVHLLDKHKINHTESMCSRNRFLCIHCDTSFKNKRSHDDHVIKKHKDFIHSSVSHRIRECNHCSYKTTNSLARHMTKHSGSMQGAKTAKQILCIHCDKTFKHKTSLDNHIIKNHIESIASVSSKIHECKHCSYKTTILSHLAGHTRTNPDGICSVKTKLSSCIHCNKRFKNKMALHDHVIRNHKEYIGSVSSKIHECKHCIYKTRILFHLTRHMEKHSESLRTDKRFPCIHCYMTFKSKKALDDHIIRNHKEFIGSVSYKIHQCKHCSYKTTFSGHLAGHVTRHHSIESSDT